MSALELNPSIADTITKGADEQKAAIEAALASLKTLLANDPKGARTVAKAEQDWRHAPPPRSGSSGSCFWQAYW